jgi:hypothetical protein
MCLPFAVYSPCASVVQLMSPQRHGNTRRDASQPPTVGRLKNKSIFRKRFSLTQISTECKAIGELSELK